MQIYNNSYWIDNMLVIFESLESYGSDIFCIFKRYVLYLNQQIIKAKEYMLDFQFTFLLLGRYQSFHRYRYSLFSPHR